MSAKGKQWLLLCVTLVALSATIAAPADTGKHPLEAPDLSSPRATLNSFLTAGDDYLRLLSEEYWENPSHAVVSRLHELETRAQRALDLSKAPPAARFGMGRDGVVYLYEVLSRIEKTRRMARRQAGPSRIPRSLLRGLPTVCAPESFCSAPRR